MIFAIGDIHGCADELKELLNKLPLTKESTVVFLGDYIDRGGQSRQVIDTVLELKDHCKVVTLMGNHEAMFVDFLENPSSQKAGLFICNGGSATLASYANKNGDYAFPKEHLQFIRDLKVFYQDDHHFFVHAGVPPNVPLESITQAKHKKKLLWIRAPFLNCEYNWSKVIVHGHTPVPRVDIRKNRINMDTGCVFMRKLSAIALPGQKIYSVDRHPVEKPVYLRDLRSRRVALRFDGVLKVDVQINGREYVFETLDYSEAGMYMKPENGNPHFPEGTRLSGQVGKDSGAVLFSGSIVRTHQRGGLYHYAVQVDKMIPAEDLPLPETYPGGHSST